MRTTLLVALTLSLSVCRAAPARAADRTLFQLDNFHHSAAAAYHLDSFSGTRGGASEETSTRHSFRERYNLGADFAVYHPRLLQGNIGLGLEADQHFESSTGGSGSGSDYTASYNLYGTLLKYKPYPVGFFVDSSLLRINPAFSRSYDLKADNCGFDFRIKNDLLPLRFSFNRSVNESSGLTRDRRDTLNAWAVSVEHTGEAAITYFGLNAADAVGSSLVGAADAVGSSLEGADERREVRSYAAALTNQWLLSSNSDLARTVNSALNYSVSGGTNPSERASWNEGVDWAFGRALKMQVDGEWSVAKQEDQTKEERLVAAALHQQIAKGITTRISSNARQTLLETGSEKALLETGSEKALSAGANVTYRNKISDRLSLLTGYHYNFGITDNDFGADSIFFSDERLNVSPLETGNYLARHDIKDGSIAVWNTSRTRMYGGADYTAVQDGRRTRIRIEPGSAIAIGDQVVIEYRVLVNARLKHQTSVHGVTASLDLRDVFLVSASWSASAQKKISGSDTTVPISKADSARIILEKFAPGYTLGTSYARLDSDYASYQKFEGYWKYRRSYETHSVEANLRDVYAVHKETGTGSTRSRGGAANEFIADASYRTTLYERVTLSLTGRYQNASGRSTDQQIFSSWLQARMRAARVEVNLNLRADWRLYRNYSERDYSLRLDFKRNF